MMVKYDKREHIINKDKRKKENGGDVMDINFDPHKLLDKVNNYKKPITPNFDLMTSRPNDGDPLPAYMKVLIIYI
jgi:hypothetical protein